MRKLMRRSVKKCFVLELETVRTHLATLSSAALGLVQGGSDNLNTSGTSTQQTHENCVVLVR
jgi:hypothetical protein